MSSLTVQFFLILELLLTSRYMYNYVTYHPLIRVAHRHFDSNGTWLSHCSILHHTFINLHETVILIAIVIIIYACALQGCVHWHVTRVSVIQLSLIYGHHVGTPAWRLAVETDTKDAWRERPFIIVIGVLVCGHHALQLDAGSRDTHVKLKLNGS